MKINKIAPFEGELVWLGEIRQGRTQRGKDWQSIDFVLKYIDDQKNERFIMFNIFGDEKVNTVFACKQGTKIRVSWRPDAHEYNGRWYGKLEAYDVTVIDEEKKEEPKQTSLPSSAPSYTPKKSEPEAPDADLPF